MSGTPRTDAFERANRRIDPFEIFDFARQLERELADCRAMLKSWYEAASPYATAEALKEALASHFTSARRVAMMTTALWTCFKCYATQRTSMDTEAATVETPSCCGRPMWLTGAIEDRSASAANSGEQK